MQTMIEQRKNKDGQILDEKEAGQWIRCSIQSRQKRKSHCVQFPHIQRT